MALPEPVDEGIGPSDEPAPGPRAPAAARATAATAPAGATATAGAGDDGRADGDRADDDRADDDRADHDRADADADDPDRLGTRARLMRAANDIANSEGLAAVTTVEVTRRAGIAQSSYYTHFASRDELIEAIGVIGADHIRRANRLARQRFRDEPHVVDRQRDLYRVPLEDIRAHPEMFRLQLRARTEPPNTPLGRVGRAAVDANRESLADDLMARGNPPDSDAVRLRYEMLADCIGAMVEQLGTGIIEGRYTDIEELVDLLILLTRGTADLGRWLSWQGPGIEAPVPSARAGPDPAAPPVRRR
jgi:AcrR family transcriptional regulator